MQSPFSCRTFVGCWGLMYGDFINSDVFYFCTSSLCNSAIFHCISWRSERRRHSFLVNMQQTVYKKMSLLCSNCFIYHLSYVAKAARIPEWSRELMVWAALASLLIFGFGFLAPVIERDPNSIRMVSDERGFILHSHQDCGLEINDHDGPQPAHPWLCKHPRQRGLEI